MMPKISIILPIFNVEKYLDKCLETVTEQTLTDIEIICVIDKSPDNSIEICKRFQAKDKRISIIEKTANEGLGFTRNTGISYATGEYIAFIDSDDYVDRDMFKNLYEYAEEHNLDGCFCNYINDLGNNRFSPTREPSEPFVCERREKVIEYMLDMVGPLPDYPTDVKHVVSVWRGIYSADIIKKNNILFESERNNASEDMPFNMDFFSHAERIGYIPFVGYYYRYNPISLSRGYTHKKFLCYMNLMNEVKQRLEKVCTEQQYKLHYQRCLYYYFRTIIKYESIKNIDGKRFSNILKRCKDKHLEYVFKDYPYWKLPLKHKVFYISMKYKIVPLLYVLCILENKIRRNI